MDFEAMPDGVFEDILSLIDDIPELVGLRSVSRRFRDVLLSPTFAAAFYGRNHPAPPSWLMAQVFDDFHIDFGALLCIEQTGDENRRTVQIPLLEFVSEEDFSCISLLAASGSLVLFSCVAIEDASCSLMVLNLYNMGVFYLDSLPPLGFSCNFEPWEHDIFTLVRHWTWFEFGFSHVAIRGSIPRCIEFTSLNGIGWDIHDVTPLKLGHELPEFDRDSGMLLVSENGDVFKVSFQWGKLVFKEGELNDMVNRSFLEAANDYFVEPAGGWESVTCSHFGKHGYAVLVHTETSPFVERFSRLKGICLFALTQDWNEFVHIATVPQHMIPPNLRDDDSKIFIKQAHNMVNITFVAPEMVHGSGDASFCCILQYRYDLETGEWESRYTPLPDFDKVYMVAFTPCLTVHPF